MNTALIKALNTEQRKLVRESNENIERNFFKKYWFIFTPDKAQALGSLETLQDATGTELVRSLGIKDTYIVKVKQTEIFNFCYDSDNSLMKQFYAKMLSPYSAVTFYYTSGSTSIVVSSEFQNLIGIGKFAHVIEPDEGVNIYWATVDSVIEKLRK